MPRLLKHAEAMRIIGDAFPTQITPEIQVNLKWPQVTPSWLAAYGHPVPPNWTIYSPEVSLVVTGNVGKEKLYTLMLTDLGKEIERERERQDVYIYETLPL